MQGRTGDSIEVVRPIEHGVVCDFDQCELMMRLFLAKARQGVFARRPRLLVSTPGDITPVERRAALGSLQRAGAASVYLMPSAIASALGAGLPLAEPVASMVCNIGAGRTEIAVMSLSETVVSRSLRIAGSTMDQAIVDYLHRQYSLTISSTTAESLRTSAGSAFPVTSEKAVEAAGLDVISGQARRASITTEEIREALGPPLAKILDAIRQCVDRAGPEMASDLIDSGLVLSGGVALLPGLDRLVTEQTGLPARVAMRPLETVIEGMLVCLENFDRWKPRLVSTENDL